jgi:hypothetical protein
MGTTSITGITSWPGAKIRIIDRGEWTEEIWEPVPIAASANGANAGTDPKAVWPTMGFDAYHGLAGELVDALLPQTEADPVALLMQCLVSFGNVVGRGPYVHRANADHHANIYTFIVGRTSRSRKGTSGQNVRSVMENVDPTWAHNNVKSGISSGEGIIELVRDARFAIDKKTKKMECVDPGIDDKRLLLDEREFSSALAKMRGDTNIVSRILREAWDGYPPILATRTKHNPSIATKPHISVVGHITLDEMRQKFADLSITDGFGNRFLYACVDRSKLLPEGGEFDQSILTKLGTKMQRAVKMAQARARMIVADEAKPTWAEFYNKIETPSPDHDGLLGHLTARAAPQALRLSMIYALLDGGSRIMLPHVEAAIAVWQFCEASARYIFATRTSDHTADEVIAAVESARPEGVSRTGFFNDTFGRHIKAHELTRALKKLEAEGRIRCEKKIVIGAKRPTEFWFAV